MPTNNSFNVGGLYPLLLILYPFKFQVDFPSNDAGAGNTSHAPSAHHGIRGSHQPIITINWQDARHQGAPGMFRFSLGELHSPF